MRSVFHGHLVRAFCRLTGSRIPSLLSGGLALSLWLALPAAAFEVIRLDDGTVIRGEVISRNDSLVEIESENLGRVTVKKKHILSSPVKDSELRPARKLAQIDPDPIGHALVLMPTAFTPPKGSMVFRDFELLFLTLGYSPTGSTSVVAGALFPVSSSFNAMTLGVKQRLFEKGNGAVALAGNVTVPIGNEIDEAAYLWLLNGVASYRFGNQVGIHMAVGGIGLQGSGASTQSLSLGLGTDLRLTPNVKLLGEVLRGGTTFDPNSSATLINFGVRLHGERLSADLCAMRPVGPDFDGIFLLPLLNVGYRF